MSGRIITCDSHGRHRELHGHSWCHACWPRPIITCDSCGQEKEHEGYGWCDPCWKRWDRAGRPESGPPPRRYGRWEEYLELTREHGYSLKNAALRMGISERTAQRHEARLRKSGIPPIAYESSRVGVLATRPASSAQHGMAVA